MNSGGLRLLKNVLVVLHILASHIAILGPVIVGGTQVIHAHNPLVF